MIQPRPTPRRVHLRPLFVGLALSTPLAAAPDFIHEVVPILKQRCAECHTDTKQKGGLSMNTEESFRKGSKNGPIINSEHPETSLVLKLIASDDEDERMPPKGKGLDAKEIETVRAWVLGGAKWEPGFAFKKPANIVEPATLAGRVRSRTTKKSLAGITIAVEGGPSAVTGDDGRFVFDDLTPGTYRLTLRGPAVDRVSATEELQPGERL